MSDKNNLQFVDTNILVYAHDISAREKHEKAKLLVHDLWESRKGCLSIQVLQEFFVTITKKVPCPINLSDAASIISDLGQWKVHAPGTDDILEAISIQKHYGLSFWDSLIINSACSLNCNVLWSEDLGNGQTYEGVRVINPFV